MYHRRSTYAPVLLLLATLTATGCDRTAAPTSPLSASGSLSAVTVEPEEVRPEFLPGCLARPAFAVRVWVRLHGGFFIRGLRVHFRDEFGTRTLPSVTSIPSPSPTPSIPSSSPVPVPGIAALPASFAAGGSLPFIVKFGCGVVPNGTLFLNADHDNGTAVMKVRIAEGN